MYAFAVYFLRGFLLATAFPGHLAAENAALRAQLDVLKAQQARPRLQRRDRLLWILLRRLWTRWREALVIVHPQTVMRWHREGFRQHWRGVCSQPGRPRIPRAHRGLIRRLSHENPGWGEDRIVLELKTKLGVEHAASTIRRYMVERLDPADPRRAGSTWRTFLGAHASQIWSMDFTSHYLWNYQLRYVLVLVEHGSRRVVHAAVTAHPTLEWIKQQVREATPYGEAPRFLIHDNDGRYGQLGRPEAVRRGVRNHRSALDRWLSEVMGIQGVPTPYAAPNANAICERFLGSFRRELLDHFIFLGDAHLRRATRDYLTYFNTCRTHQGIDGIPRDGPGLPLVESPRSGDAPIELVVEDFLHGLHRDYRLAA